MEVVLVGGDSSAPFLGRGDQHEHQVPVALLEVPPVNFILLHLVAVAFHLGRLQRTLE